MQRAEGSETSAEFPEPGDYPIGCFPFDGTDYGEPSYIVVSVVERPVNTPPNLKWVSPFTKTIETEPGRWSPGTSCGLRRCRCRCRDGQF